MKNGLIIDLSTDIAGRDNADGFSAPVGSAPNSFFNINAAEGGFFVINGGDWNTSKGASVLFDTVAGILTLRSNMNHPALVCDGAASVKIVNNVGFYGTEPVAKQVVSGIKIDPVAASILAALVALGLVTDSTT